MKTVNGYIAVQPFDFDAYAASLNSSSTSVTGFEVKKALGEGLIGTEAVFDSEDYLKGDSLFFNVEAMRNQRFVRNILNFNDIPFILVPKEMVIAVKAKD